MHEYLRLSTPEMLTCLAILGIKDFEQAGNNPYKDWSAEQAKGAMLAARDTLFARGLAKPGQKNQLVLDDSLAALLVACARPAGAVWRVSKHDRNEENKHRFLNLVPPVTVSYSIDNGAIHRFGYVEGKDAFVQACIAQEIEHLPAVSVERQYFITAQQLQLLLEMPDSPNREETVGVQLIAAGVADEDARSFARHFCDAKHQITLVYMESVNAGGRQKKPRAISWLMSDSVAWIVSEDDVADKARLEVGGSDLLKARISDYASSVYESAVVAYT